MLILKLREETYYERKKKHCSKSEYDCMIFTYLEDWAEAMEKEINPPYSMQEIIQTLRKIMNTTSHQVDQGVSGFQHDVAFVLLTEYWVYGDLLRIAYILNKVEDGLSLDEDELHLYTMYIESLNGIGEYEELY